MFNLDIQLFNFIYSNCRHLGSMFGYGAFEGLVVYTGLIVLGINSVTNAKKVKG